MKAFYIVLALCLAAVEITGNCHYKIEKSSQHCRAPDGTVIQVNTTYTDKDNCEKCTCSAGSSSTQLALQCCGYGIHAGVFAPPSGCRAVPDTDGCSIKLVSATDINQLCLFG